ncbi:MAG: sigma-70 family RNA polymerase sigma factor [Proteobacteria bacterium]|nr:sigma-70 family RNA polymerase sigma factor [Desulfobacterales bacterium]MBL6968071.1 sigma-70 family RNA polymerase sigma factor [Desulfobacteraceae bacterium]MBU0734534.1 sigma-70 family RNA polymerase sigma factor [Pseudomonadota bacterium]MBL7102686.1 sigma-70 family RNA polymerase sigma factor [Desulfobacteraceae bacterium]MBL7171299.1 sigma-70 family RNA polymerase sigma factor [Desulfobacteraceae bacterium]
MLDAPRDSEIVRRILQGDVNAFGLLLDRYKDHALKIIKKRVPASEVEDIAQEAFVKAYQSLPGFDPESHFRKWLSTITVRTCHDYWRKAYRTRELPMSALSERHREWLECVISSESNASADGRARQEEAKEVLAWALDRLSPEDRMVVEMVYLEGMTGREAAELLGWSTANVKVRAFRSRRRLRKLLTGLLEREEGRL